MQQGVRNIVCFAVAIVLLVGLTACGGEDDEQDMERGAADATPAAGEANQVEVILTEYSIEMPDSIPAGQIAFVVTNEGAEEHNFEVEGQGIEEEFDENLQPGDTKTLNVDLQPGTYEVYCPVDDHEELGMKLELTGQ